MKLTKLHLFLMIIVVLLLSTLGFSIKEYFESGPGDSQDAMNNQIEKRTDSQGEDPALKGGSNYDPFRNADTSDTLRNADTSDTLRNADTSDTLRNADTSDPLNDNDYSKTIAGLEDIVVPGRGTEVTRHHKDNGKHTPGAHGSSKGNYKEQLETEERRRTSNDDIDMSKYILKSEIVPPVCPKCPDSKTCPGLARQKPCPSCPPCGRCPEPAFECKKVPNYSAVNSSNSGGLLPMPRLNSFAQFN